MTNSTWKQGHKDATENKPVKPLGTPYQREQYAFGRRAAEEQSKK